MLGEGNKKPRNLIGADIILCPRGFFSFCMVSTCLVFEKALPAAEQERKQFSSPCESMVGWLMDVGHLKNLSEQMRQRLPSVCCTSLLGSLEL